MNLIVDANVLVGEVLPDRGRAFLANPNLKIYAVEKIIDETCYELQRRPRIMRKRGAERDGSTTETLENADIWQLVQKLYSQGYLEIILSPRNLS